MKDNRPKFVPRCSQVFGGTFFSAYNGTTSYRFSLTSCVLRCVWNVFQAVCQAPYTFPIVYKSCYFKKLLLINQTIYVHVWVFVCYQYWGLLHCNALPAFSLRDASFIINVIDIGNLLNHVQNIRERDCSFVSDLKLRSRQRFARNHELPYSLWLSSRF